MCSFPSHWRPRKRQIHSRVAFDANSRRNLTDELH